MALKKEVQIKIGGRHLSGRILGDRYITNSLISTPAGRDYNVAQLKDIISELNELVDTMESISVAEILSGE